MNPSNTQSQQTAAPKKEAKTQKKRRSFSIQEDCYLAQAVQKYGEKNWDKVATMVPTRNARQCKERWMSYLSPSLINGPWTKEEDDLLYKLCVTYGKHWTCLTKFFRGRSDNNLKNRWYSVLQHKIPQYQQQSSPNLSYQNSPQAMNSVQISSQQEQYNQEQPVVSVPVKQQQDTIINLEPKEANVTISPVFEQINEYQYDDINGIESFIYEPYVETEPLCEF